MKDDERSDVGKAADPHEVGRQKEKKSHSRDWELKDISAVFGFAPARRFLKRLVAQSGLLNPYCFQDSERVQFAAGRREMGVWVVAELAAVDKDALAKLLVEKGPEGE